MEGKGEAKGELIGSIKMARRILGIPLSPPDEFERKSIPKLKDMLADIEVKLGNI